MRWIQLPVIVVSLLAFVGCTNQPKTGPLGMSGKDAEKALIVSGEVTRLKGACTIDKKTYQVEQVRVIESLKGKAPGQLIDVLISDAANDGISHLVGSTGIWILRADESGRLISIDKVRPLDWERRQEIRRLLDADALPWSAEVDGLQLAMTAQKLPASSGDAAKIELYVRNNSNRTLTLATNGKTCPVAIDATWPDGKMQSLPVATPLTKSIVVELAPWQVLNLSDAMRLQTDFPLVPAAPVYQIKASFKNPEPAVPGAWKGQVATRAITLR